MDLKVTFKSTKHWTYIYIKKSSLRLSVWVNNQVEPAYKKIIGGVCGKNMVKSHFFFISYTDIVQVFQCMFSDDMILNKWPLENRSMLFGSLWNPSIFDEINQKKDKKEDIYVLLLRWISNSTTLKKNSWTSKLHCILELSYKFK